MERLMFSYMNVNEAELVVRKQEQMFMGFPYCNFSKHTWYLANARDIHSVAKVYAVFPFYDVKCICSFNI